MGIYDREYSRGEEPGFHFGGGARTATTTLVLITIAVYVLQLLTSDDRAAAPGGITGLLALQSDTWRYPWKWYQFFSYGFLHATGDLKHILFNMFGFWMFGRDVEQRYGRREYVTFYLVAIFVAGISWLITDNLSAGPAGTAVLIGASGGVAAVLILFALNYPRRTVLLFGIVPMPAWVLAVLIVLLDLNGALARPHGGEGSNVAYIAHLGGSAFALFYFYSGLALERYIPSRLSADIFKRRPKLRVHTPDEPPNEGLSGQVDEILRKIQQQGQESLSRRERRILEKASREFQRRRD